jgi:hypothetical protein
MRASLYFPLQELVPLIRRSLVIGGQGVSVNCRGNVRVSVTQSSRHDWKRNSVGQQTARVSVSQCVERCITDPGLFHTSHKGLTYQSRIHI